MMPKRIQRKRTKGWKMPEGAVYVGRPSDFGNPYRIGDDDPTADGKRLDAEGAVRMYRWYLESRPFLKEYATLELRGRDLVCWCPLDRPCHADVLLELVNR